jgi:hypothetical protein
MATDAQHVAQHDSAIARGFHAILGCVIRRIEAQSINDQDKARTSNVRRGCTVRRTTRDN